MGVLSLMMLPVVHAQTCEGENADAKLIAGIAVLNYHVGVAGKCMDKEGQWVVTLKPGVTDTQIIEMCRAAKNGYKLSGNPSKGDVPLFEVRGTQSDLEAVILSGRGAVEFVELDTVVQDIPDLKAGSTEAGPWVVVSSGILVYHGVALCAYSIFALLVIAEESVRKLEQLDRVTTVLPARFLIVNICGLWVMASGIVSIAVGLATLFHHHAFAQHVDVHRGFILVMGLTHSVELSLKFRNGMHLVPNAMATNGQFILLLIVAGICAR